MSTTYKKPLNAQVAIIGAGPYGLAAAAHLRATGTETIIFGEAMEFWEKQMPKGMFLRSSWDASHIADTGRALTLNSYQQSEGISVSKPIPLSDFIEYGRWFQRRVAPDLDSRRVLRIDQSDHGFHLTLDDGNRVAVARVVVATGIASFTRRTRQLEPLPAELVSHSSEHRDLTRFKGNRVIVVGGGQSALESAALLDEAGAEVEVLVRAPKINWLDQRATWLKSPRNPLRPLLYPPTDVGPPGYNLIVATPGLFRRLPGAWQEKIAYRSIRPAGSGWLVPRLKNVRIVTGCQIESGGVSSSVVRLKLSDGSERTADHVFQATGYRVDIARYPFLPPELAQRVRVMDGYPILNAAFESSVAGLHFIGATAAKSFGPVCRFVSGTPFTARTLAHGIASRPRAQWNCY